MSYFSIPRARGYVRGFDFETLFIEELGWDYTRTRTLKLPVDDTTYTLEAVAEKRGVLALLYEAEGNIPPYAVRRKIERRVAEWYYEHIIIYIDRARTTQIWQWVRRELGKPLASREHHYTTAQSGDALLQKLQTMAFDLAEEEGLTVVQVSGRVRAAFDVKRATKQFYKRFNKERRAFQKFLSGVPDEDMASWYVSVMLNRLMFVYFIQKKGFLDDDSDYLRHKLIASERQAHDRFYRDFLCPLFFEGFARPPDQRPAEVRALLGQVPYLNGGIFQMHAVEQHHGEAIQIPDKVFRRVFDFFDEYQWHLDDRPLRDDQEINPDVLGYIFEKYINQKQMGAYYTQEDITSYISENTILPFLLERVQQACPEAFTGEDSVWSLLAANPDRYIYPAMRKGCDLPLPDAIQAGVADVDQREAWNTPTPDEYALPTEIWRETVARRQRYAEVRDQVAAGEVTDANALVTLNLDSQQFVQDTLGDTNNPTFLRAFWRALNEVSVLDPTCGSGAFLFAALNILEPLYEACLERMGAFVQELAPDAHPHKYKDFRETLAEVERHPNQRYFVLKSIVINNLYGVDIMPEAVEIAKLRLFLKLVAQVERVGHIEPLPDIDFNIRAGNTLVGFATYDEVDKAVHQAGDQLKMMGVMEEEDPMVAIEQKAQDVDRLYQLFRQQQTTLGGEVRPKDKAELRRRLDALNDELDHYLAKQYGVDADLPMDLHAWRKSHQPFHWFVEFYGVLKEGGFDVIIGNPPYVEYRKVKREYKIFGYDTESCGNLYAFVMERSFDLTHHHGWNGMIVQLPIVCTDRMQPLQEQCIKRNEQVYFANFDDRPGKLFDGLQHIRASIILAHKAEDTDANVYSTRYNRWYSETRDVLFQELSFTPTTKYVQDGSIPKTGTGNTGKLIQKISDFSPLGIHLNNKGSHHVYYHNAPQYWIRAMTFVPYFWNERDGEKVSSHVKSLNFTNQADALVATALLNSSLFYWWFILLSNCRDLTLREIVNFPISLQEMSGTLKAELGKLTGTLMRDLQKHSERREANYKTTGKVIYDIYYPRYSKSIIDEIDRVLAEHYGFTDEELDFILNYDIKYRMGDELFEDEED